MKTIHEYARAFFVSCEVLVWTIGLFVFVLASDQIDLELAEWRPAEGKVMWILTIPSGITIWIVSSWKKILFQEADKKYLLQQWPDFWRLEVVLMCAVTHAGLFLLVAVFAVLSPSWAPPPSWAVIGLGVSVIGLILDGFTCYKADIELAKAVRMFDSNKK